MDSPQNIAIIILAAGASSRMGRTKQLLPWEDTTLLGHAIRTATDSVAQSVIVVLGAHAESVRKAISGDVEILENTSWKSGLGSSIARGTEFLMKHTKADGVLIMLADQPLVDTSYLNSMMGAFDREEKGIIATAYPHSVGVPALFAASYFGPLAKLDDDQGAKKIIDEHEADVLVLKPANKMVDIDTKREYENLINSKNKT